ncbi:hypothetical protein FQA47_024560 [Oryzias melastigma]|uniref:Uncharacterized protein n=1 Tax=Oryzias melastigma TaxID=30732 RepID=A0A834KZB6_ORYME|nr:hypothetical protein FQA47_024560 [Oryzias melastigma]
MMRGRRRCGGARHRVIYPGGKGSADMLFMTGAVSSKEGSGWRVIILPGGQRSPQTRSMSSLSSGPSPASAKTDISHVHFIKPECAPHEPFCSMCNISTMDASGRKILKWKHGRKSCIQLKQIPAASQSILILSALFKIP